MLHALARQARFAGGSSGGTGAAVVARIAPGGLRSDSGGSVTSDGLPVGVALDGPAGSDRRLLGIGLAVQRVLKPVPGPKM
jgi:Asp-tRNA(Asn)/Glu-tRNA(Gln) amidotransferase A subunit family amidase